MTGTKRPLSSNVLCFWAKYLTPCCHSPPRKPDKNARLGTNDGLNVTKRLLLYFIAIDPPVGEANAVIGKTSLGQQDGHK